MNKQQQFTERASDAIFRAKEKSVTERINIVSPIVLLSTILDNVDNNYLCKKILTTDDLSSLKLIINNIIAYLVKGNLITDSEVGFDNSMVTIIKDATIKKRGEFISIDLLCLLCLKYLEKNINNYQHNRNESENNKNKNKKKFINDSIKQLENEVNKKEINSPNDDDPEDTMSKYAVDMVSLARQNKFDPVIGRDSEIRQIIEILAKKTKSNVIMVGKPGVGKTAIVTGISQLIAKQNIDITKNILLNKKIYNVDISGMVAGSEYRGSFETKLKDLLKEAESNDDIILFIDEIHIVLGAGSSGKGSMDAANILKPALASGKIKVIGATTYDEYRKHIKKDPAFERRFVKVNIKEPTIEDTITILRGLRNSLETYHGIRISDKSLVYASKVCKKYISNRRLPDLAIDLVDTACASTVITLNSESPEIHALKNTLWSHQLEKTSLEMDLGRNNDLQNKELINKNLINVEKKIIEDEKKINLLNEQFYSDREYILKIKEIRRKIENVKFKIEEARSKNDRYTVLDLQSNVLPNYEEQLLNFENNAEQIEPFHIAQVISRLTNIPVQKLNLSETERLNNMESRIENYVFGQENAISTICDSIISNRLNFNDPKKPIGSFLFVGPTGVGKTELSKQLCKEINDTDENMVVLDMSDYSAQISLTKLIGATAGYVGYDEGGTLTEPVKEMPYNVILLDEIDLANQTVLNVLYQLLDEGRVIDGSGEKVNFRNTIVIMTTNLGSQFIEDKPSLINLLNKRFGQALINRIDNIIPFKKLDKKALSSILNLEIDLFNKKLYEHKVRMIISDYVLDKAILDAIDSNYGGRVLKRFIKDNFMRPISKIVLNLTDGESKGFTNVYITHVEEGGINGSFNFGSFNLVVVNGMSE